MTSRMRRHGARTCAVAALALAALAAAWWWWPPDPIRVLRAHAPALARVEREPAPLLGARVQHWRLISSAGDTATALWRGAPPGTAAPWTVVLLGGLHTGDRAVLLLPPDGPFNALAVDWPWHGPRRLTPWRFVLEAPAIRTAVLRSPGVLARGVEAAVRAPEVDEERIALLGASLGVPPALAALRLTRAPRALVLVDGAADLRALLETGLEREQIPAVLAAPLAALGSRLVRPLEPSLHVGAAARLPVLLINGEADEFLPRAAVRRLQQGLPHARVRWRPGPHLRPGRAQLIADLASEVVGWLETLPRGARSPRPGRPGARHPPATAPLRRPSRASTRWP